MESRDYSIENRPKDKNYTICFRYNNIHSIILSSAMEEFDVRKSEMLRRIIVEWNMLRHSD